CVPLSRLCSWSSEVSCFFFFQSEDGIRDWSVTGVQTCALPIYERRGRGRIDRVDLDAGRLRRQHEECALVRLEEKIEADLVVVRSEEHTSELQSLTNLVCRLLLEKKKK